MAFDLLLGWHDSECLDDVDQFDQVHHGFAVGVEVETLTVAEGSRQYIFERFLVHILRSPHLWDRVLGVEVIACFGAEADQRLLVVEADESRVAGAADFVPHAHLAHEHGVELVAVHFCSRCRFS